MASPTPIPADSWGVDTSYPLTPLQLVKLKKTPLPIEGGQPITFVWQYLPRGSLGAGAESMERAQAAVDAGLILLLVQYGPPKAGYIVDADKGVSDGTAAAKWAKACDYPQGCHIALDLEGLASTGGIARDYIIAWCAQVHEAGYLTCAYVGYAPGQTPQQFGALAEQGYIDAFWSDAAARTPPDGHGFDMKQFWTIRLFSVDNIPFDPNHALTGRLIGMGPDLPAPTTNDALISMPGDPAAGGGA